MRDKGKRINATAGLEAHLSGVSLPNYAIFLAAKRYAFPIFNDSL